MLPGWLTTVRGRVPRWAAVLLGCLPILALLAAWWLLTQGPVEERAISPNILPSPGEVFSGSILHRLAVDRDLLHHVLVSLRRVALGYLLAAVIVLPLGLVMGAFGSARATFSPLTTASGYIPIATLVPLTMSWFGTGERQKVVFLAMAFGIYLLPLVVRAIQRVPEVYLRTSYTLGAGRWSAVLRVLMPIALPEIWHGMRLAFGVGWTYLVLTEVVVLVDGLGYLVAQSQRRGPREHIYLVIIVITIIAWVSDLGWDRLGRLLFPYRSSQA
jgi:ABC-type nitrate/sulfonate/bicarbonate transport system permease component